MSNRRKTVEAMCMTWRHDFGLNKSGNCRLSSGMTEDERNALRNQMDQLYSHHIEPLVAQIDELQLTRNDSEVAKARAAAESLGWTGAGDETPLRYLVRMALASRPSEQEQARALCSTCNDSGVATVPHPQYGFMTDVACPDCPDVRGE